MSAFYIALLGLIAGFVGATLVNASVDTALGYASSQLGPRFTQRRPVAIDRRQTFLVKWAVAAVAAPVLTGIVLLVAAGEDRSPARLLRDGELDETGPAVLAAARAFPVGG